MPQWRTKNLRSTTEAVLLSAEVLDQLQVPLTFRQHDATDLHVKQGCGYHVYEIDPAAHRVKISRRSWNPGSGSHEAQPDSPPKS